MRDRHEVQPQQLLVRVMARSILDRRSRIAVSVAFATWCSLIACSSDGTDEAPELQDGGGEASFDAPPPQPDAGADATRPDADPPDVVDPGKTDPLVRDNPG